MLTHAVRTLVLLGLSGALAAQEPKPRVVILTTGGTIASQRGDSVIDGPSLVRAVPQLLQHATVSVEEIVRIGSSRMTPDIWLRLGRRINELFATQPDLAGVVVTHGTDTMEETGYFLHLTVKDSRPVVMVGSMRSANAISADGPDNLLDAVRVTVHPDAQGRGVLIVLNDEINSARDVWKTDNERVQTFRTSDRGLIGIADRDRIEFFRSPHRQHTHDSEFDVRSVNALPDVAIVTDYVGYDGAGISQLVEGGAPGIVVETFAGGRMSAGADAGIRAALRHNVPVVIASRVPGGRVVGPAQIEGTVLARDLSAHKARVLLMVALGAGLRGAQLERVFESY